MNATLIVSFGARLLLVVLFPFSALDKVMHWKSALEQASSSFVPGGPALLAGAIVVETVAPFCIVLDWHDRLAAAVLALFCVVTALLYHAFWKYPDFWSNDASPGRAHFWDFLKNLGLAGGLLLVVLGTHPAPLADVLAHPLAASSAYSIEAHGH
ncbi:MAG TPA: DoxX family protein [Usitatibacter sp.]|nr:DoxX family protein [Usitatibacter sp.]HXS54269.1 DoxX family protein [Usitatibacter sp.]